MLSIRSTACLKPCRAGSTTRTLVTARGVRQRLEVALLSTALLVGAAEDAFATDKQFEQERAYQEELLAAIRSRTHQDVALPSLEAPPVDASPAREAAAVAVSVNTPPKARAEAARAAAIQSQDAARASLAATTADGVRQERRPAVEDRKGGSPAAVLVGATLAAAIATAAYSSNSESGAAAKVATSGTQHSH